MQLEATVPIKYRLKSGEEVTLKPGIPMDIPEQAANQLLLKMPDKVRRATSGHAVIIEPAVANARSVFWESGDARILGPAIPEFLARDGSTFWIVTTFEGQIRWINADRLRSKKALDTQREVQEIELIRGF